MTQADTILDGVYNSLNLQNSTEAQKYSQINQIVTALQAINAANRIKVKVTGTISERLCELALKTAVPNIYFSLGRNWKWIGDFSITGNPFNLIISVKSFKGRERLMASGTGNVLSPTIGWGLFHNVNEWTPARVKGYLFRAFICIYMPQQLYQQLPQGSTVVQNVNAKPFLRSIGDFVTDLSNALTSQKIDITKI